MHLAHLTVYSFTLTPASYTQERDGTTVDCTEVIFSDWRFPLRLMHWYRFVTEQWRKVSVDFGGLRLAVKGLHKGPGSLLAYVVDPHGHQPKLEITSPKRFTVSS